MEAVTTSLYDRAAILPGRSCTRSKSPDRLIRAWANDADGAVITDTTGKTYIDMVCGLGAISLGYRSTREFTDYWSHGVYSLPHETEIEAVEAVLTHVAPWASSVRPVKTGSEATHAAYRIAKKATGRDLVLIGDWAYHGWHEWCSFPPGAGVALYPNGFDLDRVLHKERLAAVFVEPHRFGQVDDEWLRSVRAFCDRVGALLVFDSMLYGGRWALGGASEYFGVIPDLECYGKAFGNGESVAFVVGREALAEHGEIVSGTFSGCVTGLSAVCDVLHTYTTEPVIETLWERGRQLQVGLRQVLPASFTTIDGCAPLTRIQFTQPGLREQFRDAMAARGVLIYPDWFMTCFSHTPNQIDLVIAAAEESARGLT